MAIKVKELFAFLQKHKIDDWNIACLDFDDYNGLWVSVYSNEKEIPNKTNYFDGGPAREWDRLIITADEDLSDVDIQNSHDDDVFED